MNSAKERARACDFPVGRPAAILDGRRVCLCVVCYFLQIIHNLQVVTGIEAMRQTISITDFIMTVFIECNSICWAALQVLHMHDTQALSKNTLNLTCSRAQIRVETFGSMLRTVLVMWNMCGVFVCTVRAAYINGRLNPH